ncbi:MAG: shikimate kinase [Phenylobacterium sp.]|nr:shikimate kinase [Phenylobacterium sp.]
MDLIFLHGPAAVGKLTVARALSALTGLPVFHNHLVVDALLAVFPFGSPDFVVLRERMWLDVFEAAAREGRSIIFTFAPENTVSETFPEEAARRIAAHGGRIRYVRLTAPVDVQDARIGAPSRRTTGKLTDVDLLRRLRASGSQTYRDLPAELELDTSLLDPESAAALIADHLGRPSYPPNGDT